MHLKKRKIKIIGAAMTMQMFIMAALGGCGEAKSHNDNLVIVEQESPALEYSFGVATVDDVVLSKNVTCIYKQLNGQEVSFDLSGKMISKVYVKEGDAVKKGQLLAELTSQNREDEIEQLQYQIRRNKLLLEHAQENENYDISSMWLTFLYQSGGSAREEEALKKNVENLQRNYRYTREDCEDAIALDEQQLSGLLKEAGQSSVYATMDGTVTKVKENLEGSTSTKGEIIMQIMDNSECLFAVEELEYMPYFREGQEIEMSISYGSGAGDYKLVPYQMQQWEDALLFAITEGNEGATIEPGAYGTMLVILDQREQVLSLPVSAVHTADGEKYVYVVGENNMREVKWIETGLCGNEKVEITTGLVEGEKVILK